MDVLVRDASFDPQVDSVVHVETQHLRKRLKQYYENGGRESPLQIVLPSGHYIPEFQNRSHPVRLPTRSNPHRPLNRSEFLQFSRRVCTAGWS